MFPILETERLELREIKQEDAENIFDCFSNEEVTRYYGQEPLTTKEQAHQFVEFFDKNYKENRGIRWGIQIKGTSTLIGTIGFNAWSSKHKRAEIGYELHPDHWRKGYATEVVSKVISYGFTELELTRIGAIVFIDNKASNELLLKLGFEKEGILRNYMYQNGMPHDTNVYSLLK
ncbi:GNAT family N-acetyltransferase [Bacillus luteolus]|uniref:GNAT family N-acetyltransferase n=1 Tax=Litchfieldia luteola TaxID=682179 RepID=A0ABR9QGL0_9BACI|nr:GNAT family protein [Cytobacillus luteolus]MBE4907631.1 GNAT family N-acetyltransferase [Cytobacillus luteolus]MBP1941082.1 ribosomal-protein-alanine N-acetyltransferase [Cytobacillus luteolus]